MYARIKIYIHPWDNGPKQTHETHVTHGAAARSLRIGRDHYRDIPVINDFKALRPVLIGTDIYRYCEERSDRFRPDRARPYSRDR